MSEQNLVVSPKEQLIVPETCRLSMDDAPWLEQLKDGAIDQSWIDDTNDLIELASLSLKPQSGVLNYNEALEARGIFYGDQLGWSNPDHKMYKTYESFKSHRERTVPVCTFIDTQRLMYKFGIDGVKIIRKQPSHMAIGADTLQKKYDAFAEMGLDFATIVNRNSAVIGLSVSSVEAKMQAFVEKGLDGPKLIKSHGAAITLPTETITKKMDFITSLGFDAPKMVNRFSGILSKSSEAISQRTKLLKSLSVQLNWQGDIMKFAQEFPAIFSYGDEKIQAHFALFARHGSPNLTEGQVQNIIVAPLGAHIIALAEGLPYTKGNLVRTRKRYPGEAEKARIDELFQNRECLEQTIGKRVVAAYERWADK